MNPAPFIDDEENIARPLRQTLTKIKSPGATPQWF
jgi:hypothetical protein